MILSPEALILVLLHDIYLMAHSEHVIDPSSCGTFPVCQGGPISWLLITAWEASAWDQYCSRPTVCSRNTNSIFSAAFTLHMCKSLFNHGAKGSTFDYVLRLASR